MFVQSAKYCLCIQQEEYIILFIGVLSTPNKLPTTTFGVVC